MVMHAEVINRQRKIQPYRLILSSIAGLHRYQTDWLYVMQGRREVRGGGAGGLRLGGGGGDRQAGGHGLPGK